MSFFKRFLGSFLGTSKRRLPDEMALLGAPEPLVAEVRRLTEDEQEQAFLRFVEGRHACVLDWKARRDDVYAGLLPLLSADERVLLPAAAEVPDDAAAAIAVLRRALSASGRRLVHTESFGDFTFLVLVPKGQEAAFVAAAGPWVIRGEGEHQGM